MLQLSWTWTLWFAGLSLCQAQPLLIEMGGGVNPQGVTAMFADDQEDRLLLAGAFTYANGVQISPGILQWSSPGFASIGCGVEWDCVSFINKAGLQNRAHTVVRWGDDIFLGGDFFFSRDGVEHNFIMKWDGLAWLPLAGGMDGPVKSIKVIDDQLIVAGWFTYADTVLCNGLARWDGQRWHRVVDVPEFFPGDENYFQDVAKFQDEWYVAGNVASIGHLAKWNGSSWEVIGGGFTGTFTQVNKLRVFEDRLYVAGSFNRCPPLGSPNNPGSGVIAWDGTNWDELGGGTCGATVGEVFSMTWWNDQLYVCGRFNRIGGVPGGKLAKWDGEEWCMLTPLNYFGNGSPGALAVYHDSLYVGGAFVDVGGQPVSCFAKWVGGDQTNGCGVLTTLEEPTGGLPFQVLLDQAAQRISLNGIPVGGTMIIIHDLTGRAISSQQAGQAPIHVADLASGIYVLTVLDNVGARLASTRFFRP